MEQIRTHRLPAWMKVPLPRGENYSKVKQLTEQYHLHTICSSGNCPNKGECWNAGTATFMILGDTCTRNCRFCNVRAAIPADVDWAEPGRVAQAIKILQLKHCVITSVARDDLEDGGIAFWALTIRTIKRVNPGVTMEVLIPDFRRKLEWLDKIIDAGPEVISHNVETVERISPRIRSLSTYHGSLEMLNYLSNKGVITKSGFMLGLGETETEVLQTMDDLRAAGVKILTIGQYLPPSELHKPVVEYVHPDVFEKYRQIALSKGFSYVESGPLVRSSYHAERHILAK
ncbi:MAG: lipoyl synthase [Bacteroidales bacterium]